LKVHLNPTQQHFYNSKRKKFTSFFKTGIELKKFVIISSKMFLENITDTRQLLQVRTADNAKVKLPLGLRFIWREGRSFRWEEQTQTRGVSRC
jgi:hypothetical protein